MEAGSMEVKSKSGPKPALKEMPRRKLGTVAEVLAGQPEPEPGMSAVALEHFSRILSQAGGHLKLADSAAVNLLARQLEEESQLKAALNAINPAINPADFMACRRALTSLQTAISGSLKSCGLSPKARESRVELQPIQQPKESAKQTGKVHAVRLPFINDTKHPDRKVSVLSDVEWSGLSIKSAEDSQAKGNQSLPSLSQLCAGEIISILTGERDDLPPAIRSLIWEIGDSVQTEG
jgi:hypothetical protein